MSRILIASQPINGHGLPIVPIVQELRTRGHEVRWYTGRKYARRAQTSGAAWEPFVHARDYDDADFDAAFPERDQQRGLAQLKFDLQHIFVGQIEGQLLDLQDIGRRWPPDVVLADQTVAAALLHEELGGPACALLGVLPLGIAGRDVAPFGLGLPPDASSLGHLRNDVLSWAAQRVVFGDASRELAAICSRLGLRPRSFEPPLAPSLMLQPSVPAFEYSRCDLPPHLHFIGPLIPPAPDRPLPGWWPEVVAPGPPVVLVTQGTLATDPRRLIGPTLAALARENVRVVVAGLHQDIDPSALGGKVWTAPFVPFAQLPSACGDLRDQWGLRRRAAGPDARRALCGGGAQ